MRVPCEKPPPSMCRGRLHQWVVKRNGFGWQVVTLVGRYERSEAIQPSKRTLWIASLTLAMTGKLTRKA
ncbi:hypothetical protein SPHINGOAX6_70289 [Sphingomonas sp. AX6]|nr:hypothetical protein SPHINGOAX6_70289 [Sphingomonas sp. AX6]